MRRLFLGVCALVFVGCFYALAWRTEKAYEVVAVATKEKAVVGSWGGQGPTYKVGWGVVDAAGINYLFPEGGLAAVGLKEKEGEIDPPLLLEIKGTPGGQSGVLVTTARRIGVIAAND